jgi:uncharacterized OB-fold protein
MTTSVPIPWRLKAQRYRLIGQMCPDCHQATFPPREVCPYCAEKRGQTLWPDHPEEATLVELPIIAFSMPALD